MNSIKGTIQYEIEIIDGQWNLKYTQSSENDLAVMAIGQQLMESSEQEFITKISEKTISGADKKFFKGRLEKVRAAKFGLQLMCNFLMNAIDDYKAYAEQNKNKAPEPLTEEQQNNIIKMMNKTVKGEA